MVFWGSEFSLLNLLLDLHRTRATLEQDLKIFLDR